MAGEDGARRYGLAMSAAFKACAAATGVTQKQLAAENHSSEARASRYLNGLRIAPADVLDSFFRFLEDHGCGLGERAREDLLTCAARPCAPAPDFTNRAGCEFRRRLGAALPVRPGCLGRFERLCGGLRPWCGSWAGLSDDLVGPGPGAARPGNGESDAPGSCHLPPAAGQPGRSGDHSAARLPESLVHVG
ncbi:helix-turn-helix transcriptional regulator [Kitasatospora sp. NPDC051914]|uniref:helix-turn-helix domain-containing protein n=1 Tax=Kitasatospora sp. NPDC051914 TaxID=3154945 RepID=UPI0034144D34